MSDKQTTIENIIREYLLEETTIKKISDKKLDFGFQFLFPPGNDPSGRPVGQNMAVIKPKEKGLLIITLGTQISRPHVEALTTLNDNGKNFFLDLRKILLVKNLMFRIDMQNHRYEISEQYFISGKGFLSKNGFYKLVRKVFSCAAYCHIILNEYCSGKIKSEDLSDSRDFMSGPGFSLYS